MRKAMFLSLLAVATVVLSACHSHIDLQYTPEQYAKLRGIELLTSPPTRAYELVAEVQGNGGRHTAKETMINAMIDAAKKAGARALIPMEFSVKGQDTGRTKSASGLEQFVYTENGRTITKGRAIQWVGN